MAERTAAIERETKETKIKVSLCLDGTGVSSIQTGIGFFDHMLDSFARHGQFDLNIEACGDLHVDAHHTIEDVGICLGKAFKKAIGDKSGITRFGNAAIPMDEALTIAAVDLSGRGFLAVDLTISQENIGDMPSHLVTEFLRAFASNAELTLHIRQFCGENPHHIVESVFKSSARALREAVSFDDRISGVPSTKGTL